MLQLFLSTSDWSGRGDDSSAKQKISLLDKMESIVWPLMLSSGGRSEARLWFCNAISGIGSLTPRQQRELFVTLLRSKQIKRGLASQLWQMIFEKRPRRVGRVLANRSYDLQKFFRGNPKRILQWFSNFSGVSGSEHSKGAKALSQFAFVNRDICWEELEWKGKHGQSPAMVATKPHYFLDLDVEKSVDNFLEYVPEFWSSNEFSESLKDGEILFIDIKFFVDLFVNLMYKEDSKEVWVVIYEFLEEESFSNLCHQLLIVLEERELCIFLEFMLIYLNPSMDPKYFGNPSHWLEVVLSKCSDRASIDQLLLLNAVINQGRQLLRFLSDEEFREEKAQVKDIVMQIFTASSNANSLALFREEWFQTRTIKVIKWLGLLSWVLQYSLVEKCQTIESWESLFICNGIDFRKSDEYALLHHDGESGLDLDDGASGRVRHRNREKRRKRRRKNIGDDVSYDDELLDLEMPSKILQSRTGSWFLSTDGYSTSWSSVDLPEHLAKHCLSTWMKLVFAE